MISLRSEQVTAILDVPELKKNTDYNELGIEATLAYMDKMYVATVARHRDIRECSLCDCGAGFGWLAFAFLMAGGKSAHIDEVHPDKLEAAKRIAAILGVEDRCSFSNKGLEALELPDRSVDIFASVETLEHVGKANIRRAVRNIERMARSIIIITAPNQLSPLVSHDARVPFSHWLPISWRRLYCRLWGTRFSEFNHFPGPWHLFPFMRRFRPTCRTLVFATYQDWLDHYPVYSPYAGGVWKEKPPRWLQFYLRLCSTFFGVFSFIVCPNLANIWVLRDKS